MKNITARCLLCNEILRSYSDDTSNLIEHLKVKHPSVNIHSLESSIATLKKNDSKTNLIRDTKQNTTEIVRELINNKYFPEKLHPSNTKFIKTRICKCTKKNSSHNASYKCKHNEQHNVGPQLSRRDFILLSDKINSCDKVNEVDQPAKIKEIFEDNSEMYRNKVDLVDKGIQTNKNAKLLESAPKSSKEKNLHSKKSIREMCKRKYVVRNPFARDTFNKKLYKTSVEKWRPGKSKIFCPCCGQLNIPVIRNRIDKITSNPINAACILSCWPLCFLPCFASFQAREYLYCSICYYFLGIYDHQAEVMHPNTETLDKKQSKT